MLSIEKIKSDLTKKKTMPNKTFKIDKKDIGLPLFISAMVPTPGGKVMLTTLFSSAKNEEEAIRNGKLAFKCDKDVTRVEIQGNKSRKIYFIITKSASGEFKIEKGSNLKSMSYYLTSTV